MTAPSRSQRCPHCGITYGEFRTGYTYGDIYEMLWTADEDPERWVYKRRHTILGRWMQIKREMWRSHIANCHHCEADRNDFSPEDWKVHQRLCWKINYRNILDESDQDDSTWWDDEANTSNTCDDLGACLPWEVPTG